MGRAVAHGRTSVPRFSDPTALALLPEEARAQVGRARSDVPPRGLKARFVRARLRHLATAMALRTVEIDDAIRAHPAPQVVILGAGLDGRAWRLPELRGVDVFEVDHPDSQRDKRSRVGALDPVGNVRFIPVDFARDDLDAALTAAGHVPSNPTTWVWEGVVMYLALADIEATLRVIARRSPPGSRLVVVYHAPSPLVRLLGFIVKRMGEPLKSSFTPSAIRALLDKYGFMAHRDESIASLGAPLDRATARAMRRITHLRIVTADRRPSFEGIEALFLDRGERPSVRREQLRRLGRWTIDRPVVARSDYWAPGVTPLFTPFG
jgi:methyltransferase (TIGR00027 family)